MCCFAAVANRSLKITSASEEPFIVEEEGLVTISTGTCTEEGGARRNGDSSSVKAIGLGVPLMAVALSSYRGVSGGGGSTALVAAGLLSTLVMLPTTRADGEDDVCTPSIELEISVPYDCPYNNYVDGQCLSTTEIAEQAVQALFVDFDTVAAEKLLATDYIQHTPTVPTGAAPVLGSIPALKDSGLGMEVHRTIAEGPLVAFHSTYTNAELFGGETLISFDVFRVEDGKVQEHWDNLQPLAGPNPSGNSMVDGPTMIKYRQETGANKEHAIGLVNNVLVEGNATAIPLFISSESYVQHNPDIADNLDGLAAGLTALAEAGLLFVYDSVDLVVAEGNFVLTGSTGSIGNVPTAYYDLFRIDGGLAVEHWDTIQSIPPAEDFAHSNGKF